ncbi:MAG TPA: NADPH-dependent F420 reductase [Candidatus Dormibacteraeota bacterium]|nr:NADPH-dependent F420 reductase [Candidatus Dormibacteraeota bacterium]
MPDGALEVGIVGGTGKLGKALAARFVRAGHRVVVGSRVASKATEAAAAIKQQLGSVDGKVRGALNMDAAAAGVVVIAVPYEGLRDVVADLATPTTARVVVSTVVPVRFVEGEGPSHVDVPEGSACEAIAALLPRARVVGALQTLSFVTLRNLESDIGSDIILTGDDAAAKSAVAGLLASLAGVRMVDGGPLRNSRYVEQLTVLLLAINSRYGRHTGIRVTDLPDELLTR